MQQCTFGLLAIQFSLQFCMFPVLMLLKAHESLRYSGTEINEHYRDLENETNALNSSSSFIVSQSVKITLVFLPERVECRVEAKGFYFFRKQKGFYGDVSVQ